MIRYRIYQEHREIDGKPRNFYIIKYIENGVRKGFMEVSDADVLLGLLIEFKIRHSDGKVNFAKRNKAPDPIELESIIETFEKFDPERPETAIYSVEYRTS